MRVGLIEYRLFRLISWLQYGIPDPSSRNTSSTALLHGELRWLRLATCRSVDVTMAKVVVVRALVRLLNVVVETELVLLRDVRRE